MENKMNFVPLIAVFLLLGCSISDFKSSTDTESASARTKGANQDATVDTTRSKTDATNTEQTEDTDDTDYQHPPPYKASGYEYYRLKLGRYNDLPLNRKPIEAYLDIRFSPAGTDRNTTTACFVDKTKSLTHTFTPENNQYADVDEFLSSSTNKDEVRYRYIRDYRSSEVEVTFQGRWKLELNWQDYLKEGGNPYKHWNNPVPLYYQAIVYYVTRTGGDDHWVRYGYSIAVDRDFVNRIPNPNMFSQAPPNYNKQLKYNPEDSCFNE